MAFGYIAGNFLYLAEQDPVGGAIADGLETGGFAEGFEQDRADAVALEPVGGQAAGDAVEQVGSEPWDADPWQDSHTPHQMGAETLRFNTAFTRWPASE